jgi:hypothetical protein
VSQTSVLLAGLTIAFLVFITARGDLKQWIGIFGI